MSSLPSSFINTIRVQDTAPFKFDPLPMLCDSALQPVHGRGANLDVHGGVVYHQGHRDGDWSAQVQSFAASEAFDTAISESVDIAHS